MRPGKSAAAVLLGVSLALAACGGEQERGVAAEVGEAASETGEVDRLRALGYVDVSDRGDDAEGVGVVKRDPSRTQVGLNFFTTAHLCRAELMTAAGIVLRSWSHQPCFRWDNTILLPDGDILAIHRSPEDESAGSDPWSRELLRMSWDGEVIWSRRMAVHHDVDLTPHGTVAVLTHQHRLMPEFHPTIPVRDHRISLLTPEGEPIEEASLTELLQTAPEIFTFQRVAPRSRKGKQELDLLHANSIEWMRDPELAARNPLYALTNVLVCIRHQDVAAIIDWERKRLLWAWGQGKVSGPHDATLLPSGNVLIFDNGLARKWSRVVEVNPLTDEVVWEYRADPPEAFFTKARGASQRLPNGNTLITDSAHARAFEVTPEGDVVWDFRSPQGKEEGKRISIVRTRRVIEVGGGDRRFGFSD